MARKNLKSDTLNLSNSGIIMGRKIDTFTLTPLNFYVENKGDLAAFRPIYWDRAFIDLDSNSKLFVIIEKNLKGNKVQLTLSLNSHYPGNNPPKLNGTVEVNFDNSVYPKKNTGKIQVPIVTPPGFTDYFVQSSNVFENDGAFVELTFPDYFDVMLVKVKVEIYTPLALSFLPRNK